MKPLLMPPSVNFHLWEPCNMRCRFCFATFQDVKRTLLPAGHLPAEEALAVVRVLAQRFDKITFAGGEPTLCPWLERLVREAKERGATTMLVTNGSRLLNGGLDAFAPWLDWVVLSIDSAHETTHKSLGRAVKGRHPIARAQLLALAEDIHRRDLRLKVNTVVTALQHDEDMRDFIRALSPERWKLLQVLPVEGQNSGQVEPLLISSEAFTRFVERHMSLETHGIAVVPEHNQDMRGSYAMVDPAGRFFDNTSGAHGPGLRRPAPRLP